jgi:excisionase family DNA binding protein
VQNLENLEVFMNQIHVGAEQFRRQLTDWLSRVGYGADHIIVERHGSPIAVMVPFQFYEEATTQMQRVIRERQPTYNTTTYMTTTESVTPTVSNNGYEQKAVLTLQEAASYLQLPVETVAQQAEAGEIPGRRVDDTWRFLKAAIDRWLYQDSRQIFLQQAGAFADDETLPLLLQQIYEARGRYEIDPDTDNTGDDEQDEQALAQEAA